MQYVLLIVVVVAGILIVRRMGLLRMGAGVATEEEYRRRMLLYSNLIKKLCDAAEQEGLDPAPIVLNYLIEMAQESPELFKQSLPYLVEIIADREDLPQLQKEIEREAMVRSEKLPPPFQEFLRELEEKDS